jgi:hypothetical protein
VSFSCSDSFMPSASQRLTEHFNSIEFIDERRFLIQRKRIRQ